MECVAEQGISILSNLVENVILKMEETEENDYVEEEEPTWRYDYVSDKGEITSESNAEIDSEALEDGFKREIGDLEEELILEENGEEEESEREYDNAQDDLSGSPQYWQDDEFEYPGEFDEEDQKPAEEVQIAASSRTLTTRSSSKPPITVKQQDEAAVDRLKIVPMKPNPCIRDRMRKWLNKDHNQPPAESFLGVQYSERTRSLDRLDEPCNNIFFKKYGRPEIQVDSRTIKTDSEKISRLRPICACGGKVEEYSSQQTKDLKTPTPDIQDLWSGASSVDERKKIPCTCGESLECLGWRVAEPEEVKVDIPQEFEVGKEESTVKELGKKPETCTCDTKDVPEEEEDEEETVREKLHNLMKMWFELKHRVCHCRKASWMATRVWEKRKRKTRCICKKLSKKRDKLQRMMKEVRDSLVDKKIQDDEARIREEEINKLYKMVGPALAAEYKELSMKHPPAPRLESNSFTKMVMREFGGQLRKYRMQNLKDGSIHREHRRGDYDSLQYVELPNGSKYYGQFSRLGMEGKCIYKMVHGPVYVGSMVDGKMEGKGQLIYPNGGIVEGTWVNGTLFDPKYTFSDGLKFQPYNWKYCRMPDRRFVSEMINGMNSPDNVQLSADHPARQIPKGCLDAGEGFYDPKKRVIIHPSTGKYK
ncbi:hypothetical protein GE061_015577 [Apolygus lucorum]|uniref:MORN repeat-containing protein 5 n=1 Tax=Apolygus lucorum TaxID=248454 RepID=A0A8S9XP64_APOLU|nr:hypothetical protein GE061_015577 [Apolygus lucorum]